MEKLFQGLEKTVGNKPGPKLDANA